MERFVTANSSFQNKHSFAISINQKTEKLSSVFNHRFSFVTKCINDWHLDLKILSKIRFQSLLTEVRCVCITSDVMIKGEFDPKYTRENCLPGQA